MADLANLFKECEQENDNILSHADDIDPDMVAFIVYVSVCSKTFNKIAVPSNEEFINDDNPAEFDYFQHLEINYTGMCLTHPYGFAIYPIILDESITYGKAMVMVEKKKA